MSRYIGTNTDVSDKLMQKIQGKLQSIQNLQVETANPLK